MKNFDFMRFFLCFLVVCCILFNMSPFHAEAVSATVAVTAVGVGIVVATAIGLQALGVRQGDDVNDFYSLVDRCSSALSAEWSVNGLVNMLAVTTDGVTRTYANRNFLQSILEWLFDSGSVTASDEFVFPGSNYEDIMTAYNKVMSYPYHLVARASNNAYWWFFGSNSELIVEPYTDGSGQYWIKASTQSADSYRFSHTGSCIYFYTGAGDSTGGFAEIYESGLVSEISTSSDLTLESVGQDLAADYSDYNASVFQHEDDKYYLPVTIPSLKTDAIADQTQADAQSGVTSESIVEELVNSQAGSDTDSASITQFLSKILDTVIALPSAISTVITQALTDVFVPADTFVATKVEALTLKYPYLNTFLLLGDSLKGFFSGLGTKPPVIYIDLGAAETDLDIGGKVVFTDLTWYAAYKPTMDAILGAFIWLWFAWRLYLSLPSIINGSTGAVGSTVRIAERLSNQNKGGDEF